MALLWKVLLKSIQHIGHTLLHYFVWNTWRGSIPHVKQPAVRIWVQGHRDDFAAFVEDDEPFDSYCTRLHEVCWVQDSNCCHSTQHTACNPHLTCAPVCRMALGRETLSCRLPASRSKSTYLCTR
jgi:hypothetical protein